MSPTAVCNSNVAAKGVPYFTPAQHPPAGTAFDPQPSGVHVPKIFTPLRIRGVEFHNRIWVSPMCQYSAQDGHMTPWHTAHLGGIFTRGPGLTTIEATAVLPNGRITPEDVGLWSDAHLPGLTSLVQFCHSQSQKIAIQLAHAGRKASTVAPWISGHPTASAEVGGWPDDVWGPSAIPYSDDYPKPKPLSKEGIKEVVHAFVEAAKRAVKAGIDVIEIHAAHGYLLGEFLSPVSNQRTDEYGGSFENRIRLVLEIVDAVRGVIPPDMPLFVRISATDWLEHLPSTPSWTSQDTTRLAPILYAHGVDLLDVSSGGNHPAQQIKGGPAYQAPLARDVLSTLGATSCYPNNTKPSPSSNDRPDRLLVATVGAITTAPVAEALLLASADVIFVGRQFLRNPFTVWAWADELSDGSRDVQVQLPAQIRWGFKGRGKRTSDGKEDCEQKVENEDMKVGSCKV